MDGRADNHSTNLKMITYEEALAHAAEQRIRNTALKGLEAIYIEEFSDIPGGLMAGMYAGLKELIKLGLFDRARVLVDSVTTAPPGVTEEQMNTVKNKIKAIFP